MPHLVEVVVEAAAVVATDGHPVTVELAIVTYTLGKEGVNYAFRNCFGVVTYEKPL